MIAKKNKPDIDIKALRTRLNMTQVELAALIGVDPISVSRWERGTKPSKLARARIAELMAKK